MTNVANQIDDDIIELTDVVIVGTGNKGARHTAQIAPDSMLASQDDNMSTDDILDSMLEEFPKMSGQSQNSLENGLNMRGLDGLLQSMHLDDESDDENAETATVSAYNTQDTQSAYTRTNSFQDTLNNNFSDNLENNSGDFSSADFSNDMTIPDDSLFNTDLFTSNPNQDSFDLMQAMGEDDSLDFSQDLEMQNNDGNQQDFGQQSFSQQDSRQQDFNQTAVLEDDFGLANDISDIVDPYSSYDANANFDQPETNLNSFAPHNTQNIPSQSFDQDFSQDFSQKMEQNMEQGINSDNMFESTNIQDSRYAQNLQDFSATMTDMDEFSVASHAMQEVQSATDAFPDAPNFDNDDFSKLSQMPLDSFDGLQDADFTQQNSSPSTGFTSQDFTQSIGTQEDVFQEQVSQKENTPFTDNLDTDVNPEIHVKQDFSDLADVDPDTLTIDDINLEDLDFDSADLNNQNPQVSIDDLESTDIENFNVLDQKDINSFSVDQNSQSFDSPLLDTLPAESSIEGLSTESSVQFLDDFPEDLDFDMNVTSPIDLPTDIPLNAEFAHNQKDIDRSAFENDEELVQMLEMPEDFSMPVSENVSQGIPSPLINDSIAPITSPEFGRINNLEEKLDAFSSSTTGRLEVLQNSVDTLSTQVASIEEHINIPQIKSADIPDIVPLEANNENAFMQNLESKVKILESRIEKLEEFLENGATQNTAHANVSQVSDNQLDTFEPIAESDALSSAYEVQAMREEMAKAMIRIDELEANIEKSVALTAARVLKEEIIPLLSDM